MEIFHFRLCLAFFCLLIGGLRIIGYSISASNRREKRMYGPDLDMVIPDLLLFGTYPLALVWAWDPSLLSFANLNLGVFPRLFGVVLELIAVMLLAAAHYSLGRSFSPELVVREGQIVVNRGVYRWIRHPMYTAGLGIMLGALFISGNLLFLGGVASMIWICTFRALREEKMMRDAFGVSYTDYMKKTGRFFPRA